MHINTYTVLHTAASAKQASPPLPSGPLGKQNTSANQNMSQFSEKFNGFSIKLFQKK